MNISGWPRSVPRRGTGLTLIKELNYTVSDLMLPSIARDDSTEQRILDAADSVFLQRGTSGARMQEIAEIAGVNQALLHYYFRTKERLAEAVFRRAAAALFPAVIAIMSSDASIEEKVGQVVEVELEHLSRRPYLPGYVICELNQHPDRVPQLIAAITGMTPDDIRPRLFRTLQHQIDEGVRAGAMRAIAPDQFLINLLSLCIFPFAARPMLVAMFGLDQRGFDRFIDRRRHELAAFFLGALRP